MRSRFTTKRPGGNVPPAPGKEEYSRSFLSEGDRTVFEDDAEYYFWDRDSFEDVPL